MSGFMSFSDVFAKAVAVIGGAALTLRKMQGVPQVEAWGATPEIPAAKSQGAIPTLKMPSARGWDEGQLPIAAPGLKVNAFATGLDHPRWIEVLPNGDVLVAESNQIPGRPRGVPMRSACPPTALRCCVTRTATASPNIAAPSWRD
jgi:glucose/arabinose dehydrogenase